MSTIPQPQTRRSAVLDDIDWQTYTRLLRIFQSQRRFRFTYDRGTLEIMSPLIEHERPAYLLGRFIDVLTDELQQPVVAGRSLTLRRRRLRRGVEADNCYWLANAARVQGLVRIDLRVDPPPDLAIECDVTSSSIPRMPIYAALGVRELWRWAAQGLTFHVLVGAAYQVQTHSAAFPGLASADVAGFLARIGQSDDRIIVQQFRDWVRQNLVPPPQQPSP